MASISKLSSWVNLKKHHVYLQDVQISHLFEDDAKRQEHFSLEALGMHFDYSRSRIDDKAMTLLYRFAEQSKIEDKIQALFKGERLNTSENKSVLHWMWREDKDEKVIIDQRNIMPVVLDARYQMKEFADKVVRGQLTGVTGKKILDVVHIGIGGSLLGVKTVVESLKQYHQIGVNIHFVSAVDGTEMDDLMYRLSPETTLFLVASKSFRTPEILALADRVKEWCDYLMGENAYKSHMIAMTATTKEAKRFGIKDEFVFPFSTQVGGRFSVWTTVGLTIVLALGWERYELFLAGGRSVDTLMKKDPVELNLPLRMALLSVWYRNFWQAEAKCIVPYAGRMKTFVPYLQQVFMESNGKTSDIDTAGVVFGGVGTDVQHSFFQALHQGTDLVPVDMILFGKPTGKDSEAHRHVSLQAMGQAEFLAFGRRKTKETKKYEYCLGNHPVHLLMVPELNPYTLGQLMAVYEYEVILEGFLWDINSFDQFGIEFGKEVYRRLEENEGLGEPSTRISLAKLQELS